MRGGVTPLACSPGRRSPGKAPTRCAATCPMGRLGARPPLQPDAPGRGRGARGHARRVRRGPAGQPGGPASNWQPAPRTADLHPVAVDRPRHPATPGYRRPSPAWGGHRHQAVLPSGASTSSTAWWPTSARGTLGRTSVGRSSPDPSTSGWSPRCPLGSRSCCWMLVRMSRIGRNRVWASIVDRNKPIRSARQTKEALTPSRVPGV